MNWRRLALNLAHWAMEGSWILAVAAILALTFGQKEPPLSIPAAFFLMAAAYGVAFVLSHLELPIGYLQGAGVVLAILCINVVAQWHVAGTFAPLDLGWTFSTAGGNEKALDQGRAAVLAWGTGMALWWRGARLAGRNAQFDSIFLSFRIGLGVFVALGLMEGFLSPPEPVSILAMPFFALALVGFILGHLERVEQEGRAQFRGKGLSIPLVTVGGILILGIIMGLVPYGDVGRALGSLAFALEWVVKGVFFVLILAVGLVAEIVITVLRWFIARMGIQPPELPENLAGDFLKELPERAGEMSPIFQYIFAAIKWSIIILILALILLWLARSLVRRQRPSPVEGNEVRESLWEEGNLGQELGAALKRLFASFRGLPGIREDGRRGIFRIYFALLGRAASLGLVREPWQTPLEIQEGLENLFSSGKGEVNRITAAFVKARYGHALPDPGEMDKLEEDWGKLHEVL